MDVYLEIGRKRAFASALDWPGWCRSAADEAGALGALGHYAPRYATAIESADAGFARFGRAPGVGSFTVVERLEGTSATDFGAPGKVPEADGAPVDSAELTRLEGILRAVWRSFDAGVEAASGKTLSVGPRGGGRDLTKMVGHVCEAEQGYLRQVGGTFERTGASRAAELAGVHEAFAAALGRRARGEIAGRGARGGVRWPVRYAVRRAAWHVLDHLWEIEDRSGAG